MMVVAGLALAAPGHTAVTPPAATAPAPNHALQLSRLLNPDDKLVDIAMRGFEVGIDTALKKSPSDAALFNGNPGLLDAIVGAGKPIVRRHVLAEIPTQQQKYAEFYARKFSNDEVDQLIAFYSTPTGAKVIAQMYAGMDLGKVAAALITKDGEGKMTTDTVGSVSNSAAQRLLPGLDADDWKALFTFMGTPAYAKLKSSIPELRQLTADLGNEADPAMDAELDKAIEVAVNSYLAAKKAKPNP